MLRQSTRWSRRSEGGIQIRGGPSTTRAAWLRDGNTLSMRAFGPISSVPWCRLSVRMQPRDDHAGGPAVAGEGHAHDGLARPHAVCLTSMKMHSWCGGVARGNREGIHLLLGEGASRSARSFHRNDTKGTVVFIRHEQIVLISQRGTTRDKA